jgi:cytoskeletal protein RodZ
MESVGAKLRAARLSRGLTLEQVAQETKLSRASLEHLENDAVHALPAPVFVRGFVRAYARAVGLEGDTLVRQLPDQVGPEPMTEREAHFASLVVMGTQRERHFRPTQSLLVLVAVAMLLAAWILGGQDRSEELADAKEPKTTVEQKVGPAPPLTATRDR